MALPSVNPAADAEMSSARAPLARVMAPLAWAAGTVALSHVPAAAHALPALGVLRGPLGGVLVAVAIVVAAAVLLPPLRVPRVSSAALVAVAWTFLLAIGLSYTMRLRVSGDEPHYLLMAQSLWREHDLDLRDNMAREDWREYTPGPVTPHYAAPRADGRPFPAHSPGLPLLLAPLYALGGRTLCVALLTLMAAALAVEMRAAARSLTGDEEAALVAWSLALGPPVAFYAFQVYTEVPSALALAVALRLLLSGPGVRGAAAAALLASSLPWLHMKMMPAAVALAIVGLARLRGRPRLVFVAAAAAMAAGFLLYYRAVFGVPSPLAVYGGLPKDADGSPLRALVGLALDRSFGLLPYAPVFVLSLAGIGALARARAWAQAVVAVAVVAPVLSWRMWWGGQCPPARFLVPLVPVLALAAAVRVAAARRGLARWRWMLAALGVATVVAMTMRPGALLLLNRGDRPTRWWAALSGEWPVGRYLPSLVAPTADEWRVAVVWVVGLAVLLGLDALAQGRDRVDRMFRGLGLPLV
ncbi:MAG: hypothetical protein DMF78_05795, partial [Acidobacteria bacterium]